jgi:hypothetical protein
MLKTYAVKTRLKHGVKESWTADWKREIEIGKHRPNGSEDETEATSAICLRQAAELFALDELTDFNNSVSKFHSKEKITGSVILVYILSTSRTKFGVNLIIKLTHFFLTT